MPNDTKKDAQDDAQETRGPRVPQEQWTRGAGVASDVPALDLHHARAITAKLRGKWNYTDALTVEYKAGKYWNDTGLTLVMPDPREGVTPEGGAREIVAMARDYSATRQHKRRIRINALGSSQSGETVKSLWVMGLDFTENLEEEDDTEAPGRDDTRRQKGIEEVATMEVMRQSMSDMMGHWGTAVSKTEKLADKIVEMAAQTSQNQAGLVEALRLEYQDRRETRESEEKARSEEENARRMDAVFEAFLTVGSSAFSDYLRSKVGGEAVDGDFSSRLAALLAKIEPEKLSQCEEILGQDSWDALQSAARGVDDETFRQLIRKMAETLPGEPPAVFMKLATVVPADIVQGIGKLLQEATTTKK